MTKIALITDTHWGARGDSVIFLKMFEKFYGDIFFPTLKEHDIKHIIHLGDVMDKRKGVSYITANAFRKNFIQPCIDEDINLDIIVGNHDVYYRNTNEINSMAELLGHLNSDKIKWHTKATRLEFDGMPIAMFPWINSENYEETMVFKNSTDAEIAMGHFDFNGFEMHRGMVQTNGMDTSLFKDFDQVYSGHFHHKSSKGNITYLGNPYELTWSDYNDTRGFHIFDTETRGLTFVQNPYRMFHKIVYNDKDLNQIELLDKDFSSYRESYIKIIVQEKTNPYWFDLFLEEIYKIEPAKVSIVEDNRNLDELSEDDIIDEAEDTLTIMNKCIDAIDMAVNKDKLKKLLSTYYNEAQALEI
jgi:DNA repair exonuclease SbcCD nuclease subunit